jgi:hypothetical protein
MTTPTAVMIPGEVRLAHMRYTLFPEIAFYGDSLTGTPTVALTAGSGNTGTLSAGTATVYPTPVGTGTEARFTLDATSAQDGDTYVVKVTALTTGGSTLVGVGTLSIKGQP